MNELSGTMDLESTLIRAESLFQRFQRTVELIDKKDNFPSAPQARQRKSIASPSTPSAASGSTSQASSSAVDKGKQVEDDQDTRVISPELRSLLSRKVEVVKKDDGAKQDGAITEK